MNEKIEHWIVNMRSETLDNEVMGDKAGVYKPGWYTLAYKKPETREEVLAAHKNGKIFMGYFWASESYNVKYNKETGQEEKHDYKKDVFFTVSLYYEHHAEQTEDDCSSCDDYNIDRRSLQFRAEDILGWMELPEIPESLFKYKAQLNEFS